MEGNSYIKLQGNSILEGGSHIFGVVADANILMSADSSALMIPISVFVARLHAANEKVCDMDVYWCMAVGNPIEACNTFINFQTRRVVVIRPPNIVARDIETFDGDWPLMNVFPQGSIRDLCPDVFVNRQAGGAPDDKFDVFNFLGLYEDDGDIPFFTEAERQNGD